MHTDLEIFSDLSEKLHYNHAGYPLYARQDKLSYYEYHAACHWHPDLEFIYIIDGKMDYFVNGKVIHLMAKQGIFVNSKRLHYGFSNKANECNFIALIVNPQSFFECGVYMQIFLEKQFGIYTEDFILLENTTEWKGQALALIQETYQKMQEQTKRLKQPLLILSKISLLCSIISDHLQTVSHSDNEIRSKMIIWRMTHFIHKNFGKKISNSDIAEAGAVCRSHCFQLFKQLVGQTPNIYLMRYRVAESCRMLCTTDISISEIAETCGFQTASYFSYIFHQQLNRTPKEYRLKFQVADQS